MFDYGDVVQVETDEGTKPFEVLHRISVPTRYNDSTMYTAVEIKDDGDGYYSEDDKVVLIRIYDDSTAVLVSE